MKKGRRLINTVLFTKTGITCNHMCSVQGFFAHNFYYGDDLFRFVFTSHDSTR
jgi:hypothetical protein